ARANSQISLHSDGLGMKRRSGSARVVALAIASVLLAFAPRDARAQGDPRDPRHAVDRFEPSARGSEWLANESLDLRGHLRPSLGYVLSYSHRVVVVGPANGLPERAPVKELALLHVGGSVVLFDRLRLALDLPFQVYAGGQSSTFVPAPPAESGVGDLRLGADVRLLGQYRGALTAAIGVQAFAPTGEKAQWTSDGVFRARPRALFAGEVGVFVWAAQVGVHVRAQTEVTASAAAGVRVARNLVLGPEVTASTFEDAFGKRATPVEALLGAHWLVDGTARIGGGVGHGLTNGVGAPAWRLMFGVEWSPEIPRERRKPGQSGARGAGGRRDAVVVLDADHDRIPDDRDACPRVVGIATNDPKTNGCPPDTDGDGVDDLTDACPTVRGVATSDPQTNGCPDRDRDHDGIPNDLDACPDDSGAPDIDPRRNGCPKAFVHESRIELLDPVEFKPGTATIAATPETEAILTAVLRVMLELPERRKLRVEGHTDDRGDPASNRTLGAARAAAVAKWLVEHGIDRARISSEGFGSERPIATNATEAGRAENRRLELHLEP
ncbi:MAG: outer membrane protein, partial [Labilithrix sp.]|nr:outer membrane protein [Labilithrix sp.]